jgi:large subunit ribosomal protein L24
MKKTMKKKAVRSKKVRKGDMVIAIAGNCRGQKGTVLQCQDDRVVVQGLNVRKKHVKRSQTNPQGGIVEIEKSLHISNVMVCVNEDQTVKLKVRTNSDGNRELYYKDGDKEVLYRSLKKS